MGPGLWHSKLSFHLRCRCPIQVRVQALVTSLPARLPVNDLGNKQRPTVGDGPNPWVPELRGGSRRSSCPVAWGQPKAGHQRNSALQVKMETNKDGRRRETERNKMTRRKDGWMKGWKEGRGREREKENRKKRKREKERKKRQRKYLRPCYLVWKCK